MELAATGVVNIKALGMERESGAGVKHWHG